MGLIDSIIGVESGGNPNATNPNSSASGLGQFIDSTWLATIREARPDLAQGKSDAELLALKTNPELSRQMTEAYANQNQAILSKAGVPVTDGNTYLAHFAGPGGAVKVLQADPSAPVADILGAGVVKANPFLARMTAGDLQAWAAKKVGGSNPQQQPTPASPAAPPRPLNLIPQQPTPTFAPPQQATEAQQAMGQAPQVQTPQAQYPQLAAQQPLGFNIPNQGPIYFAPRRSPDLSKLRASFGGSFFGKS